MSGPIPEKFKAYFDLSDDAVDDYYILLLAIDLYLSEKVSLGKAAELANLSFDQFIHELQVRNIRRITGYSVDDLEAEGSVLNKYAKQH